VLGVPGYPRSNWEWTKVIIKSIGQLIRLRSFKHVIVLELDAVDKEIEAFWLKWLLPKLVVQTETNITLKQARLRAVEVAERFGIDAEVAEVILEDIQLPEARITVHPGENGSTVIDATHYFYPIDIRSVLEVIGEQSEFSKQIIMSDSRVDFEALNHDEWLFNPIEITTGPDVLILLRGYAPVVRRKFSGLIAN
jgi:hypothetical protein